MKVGSLVRRRYQWHSRLGVVLETASRKSDGRMATFRIHWFVDPRYNGWYGAHKLDLAYESR